VSQQLIQQFVKHLSDKQKSEATVVAYRKDIEQLDKLLAGQWHTCSSADIQTALFQLAETKKLSAKSVSRKLNSVRTFCAYLQEQGINQGNPAQAVPHPKFESAAPRILNNTEIAQVRTACAAQPRELLIFELLLQTGMRISELAELQIKDVRLNGHFREIELMDTTQKFPRRIPINARLNDALTQTGVITTDGTDAENYLIQGSKRGRPMSVRNIRNNLEKSIQKAGIADATINDLRNTFIVVQLSAGLPVEHISQVVGHTSPTTTAKYLKLLPTEYKPSGEIKLVDV
jgi:site-specific recombinase XerD